MSSSSWSPSSSSSSTASAAASSSPTHSSATSHLHQLNRPPPINCPTLRLLILFIYSATANSSRP
eukprot:5942237-Pyramimonas_sp.AAC.1